MSRTFAVGILATCLAVPTLARAEADGPDTWAVTGVAAKDVLNIRAEPNASSRIVGTIPPNGRSLANLGCTGIPDFAQWEKMSERARQAASANRWCRVRYRGTVGWVRGKFLAEGGPD
jgi:uncharacterized protein YgiM (DUF1202 family)